MDNTEKFFWVIMISMCICIVIVVYTVLTAGSVYEDVKIKTLSPATALSGSFTLGTGNIDSSQSYISYVKLPDGGLHQISICAGLSNVYMDTETDPYIRVWYKEQNLLGFKSRTTKSYLYEIHVPNGTIIQG
jgi:hypothetical protein